MTMMTPENPSKEWLRKQELQQAIAKFNKEHAEKSFSGRHPELGRMINCQICGNRHREHDSIVVCTQRFCTSKHDSSVLLTSDSAHDGPATIKDVIGAAAFAKKRRNPHFSHRRLQLVQMTQQIFHEEFEPYFTDHVSSMKQARMIAAIALKNARRVRSQSKQHQQDCSRRINRGLLPGGAR